MTKQYLIESSHTKEECLDAMDKMSAMGPKHLSKFSWGCMAGDHTGYAITDADSESQAMDMVPPSLQSKAKVVPVEKYSQEQIKSFHQM